MDSNYKWSFKISSFIAAIFLKGLLIRNGLVAGLYKRSDAVLVINQQGLQQQMFPGKNTVKPILRGHPWDKEKWPYETGDLLKEVP